MCIIIVNKDNDLSDDVLNNSFDGNEDGAGIAWAKDNKVHSFKTMLKKDFIAHYRALREDGVKNILLHCRITTHGSTGLKNSHPFPVHDNMMMMHNGIIDLRYFEEELGMTKKTEAEWKALDHSDTALFALYLTHNFPKNIVLNPHAQSIIAKLIGNRNKLAFIDNTGRMAVINASQGVSEGDNWFSNSSYKTKKYKYEYKNYTYHNTCDYCGVYDTKCAKLYGFTYCPEHHLMVFQGDKDKCDVCHADLKDKITFTQNGVDLCSECSVKAPIYTNCEGCAYYKKCVMVENTRLCHTCISGAKIDDKKEKKVIIVEGTEEAYCKVCDKKRPDCKKWNGVWLCLDCIRLAKKTKTYTWGEHKCCNCKTSKKLQFKKIKHAFLCVECINGEDEEEIKELCPHCKGLTGSFQGYLCDECGMNKKMVKDSDDKFIEEMEKQYGKGWQMM